MIKKIIRRSIGHTEKLSDAGLHPVLQRIFSARGISDVAEIDYQLTQLLPYHQLLQIDAAVAQLYWAISERKRIMVIGDFDADGATSTALAVSALRVFGAHDVAYLVPNRFEYGYGLTPEIVDVAAQSQPDLIITVDNGISSVQGVERANALGIRVLITDHHLPGAQLPAAVAIVNPNQPGDAFPSKNLAGVGVCFYVMLALRRKLVDENWFVQQQMSEPNMSQFLDLVALGTVADVVPLDRNNRILIAQGLARIRAQKARIGLAAMISVAKRQAKSVTASDLGFAIGPRLNAAGRLDDMSLGIECLLCGDEKTALEMATLLDQLNQERREIETQMMAQALHAFEKLSFDEHNMPLGLCIYDPSWHQGVIGILASRIKERFNRPVIAFALVENDEVKGSARSVAGVHIRDVLDLIAKNHPHLIAKFGGHAMAAGLSLKRADLPEFSRVFAEEVSKLIDHSSCQGAITTDGELAAHDFSLPLAQQLREAGPWGQNFPEPVFDGVFHIVDQRVVGGRHLKLTLTTADQTQLIDAIAFNINENQWPNYHCKQLEAVYRLDINEYQGRQSVQLLIEQLTAVVHE